MMKPSFTELEAQRLALQDVLDGQLDSIARNKKGQFATPTALAVDIQRYAKERFGDSEKVRFIDPAIGTGSFYSALLGVFPPRLIDTAVGYEIDPHYGGPAMKLWRDVGLDMRLEDFTQAEPPVPAERFNLLICNPPYVRHHHIASREKQRLKMRTRNACGLDISGLAGLYCYFLGLSHAWMADGGLAGWLIPSEFMDVNYGISVKRYLLNKVTLLHIHRFDPNDVQFGDAVVSSAIVWFRNAPPPMTGNVRFTFGGTLERPKLERLVSMEALRHDPKWTRYPIKKTHKVVEGPVLGDFFRIQRGLATGNNSYFILSERQIERRGMPMDAFKPILPSPRYLPDDEIKCDCDGNPVLERRLFLLDPPWTESEIKERYPKLWAYLEEGKAEGIADRYLCRHRATWYTQEHRPPAPFVCTYLGRSNKKNGRPFRFILNNSKATAANVYLMLYPRAPLKHALLDRPELKRQVWKYLNKISPQAMLGEGRVYGGGLHKLEPRELGNVPAKAIIELFPALAGQPLEGQVELFEEAVA
ncbi:MAG: SAM-dependent DNA methyltransferase [Gammaproteobacteria bacterium]|nr:SAM-dependent DNA methyltransferase [Gammaproteobacteria bacterium]